MSTIINHTSVAVIFATDRDSSIKQRIVNMVSRRNARNVLQRKFYVYVD